MRENIVWRSVSQIHRNNQPQYNLLKQDPKFNPDQKVRFDFSLFSLTVPYESYLWLLLVYSNSVHKWSFQGLGHHLCTREITRVDKIAYLDPASNPGSNVQCCKGSTSVAFFVNFWQNFIQMITCFQVQHIQILGVLSAREMGEPCRKIKTRINNLRSNGLVTSKLVISLVP